MRHLLTQDNGRREQCPHGIALAFSFLMMWDHSKDKRRADMGNYHNSSVEFLPCKQGEIRKTCGAEPSLRPSPSSPAGSPQFFALCLPTKATLYLCKQNVEGVAHWKQPASIHTPERRQVQSPAWHCDPRYTENLFPLHCSKSYRKEMAPRNGDHHMLCNVLL